MRCIEIRAGGVLIRAMLRATATADALCRALPINAADKTWGEEVHLDVPVSCARQSDARDVVSAGEIAYWPDGEAIAIGYGRTPVSRGEEIRRASPVNIWADARDDVDAPGSVRSGQPVSVTAAPPGRC